MKFETIQDVFEDELFDIYNAEEQLTKALPKMAGKATNTDLAQAFTSHLQETKNQIARLQRIFDLLDLEIRKEECKAMKGLIAEAEHMIKMAEKGTVLDATLIMLSQKVEHYEIATYGSLRALALQLGYRDVADILGETYDEELAADETLTALAEGHINEDALRRSAA